MRILWIRIGSLHPLDSDEKRLTCRLLQELKRENTVTVLSLIPDGSPEDLLKQGQEYATKNAWVSIKETPDGSLSYRFQQVCNFLYGSAAPLAIGRFTHLKMEEKIVELVHADKHDLVICESLLPADGIINVEHAVKIPAVLFLHHSQAPPSEPQADDPSRGWIQNLFEKNQQERIVEFEEMACRAFDGVLPATPELADQLQREYRLNNVIAAPPSAQQTTAPPLEPTAHLSDILANFCRQQKKAEKIDT